jgi:hypothetical protein
VFGFGYCFHGLGLIVTQFKFSEFFGLVGEIFFGLGNILGNGVGCCGVGRQDYSRGLIIVARALLLELKL